MTITLMILSVVLLAAVAPWLGADTRRPETLRARGAGIIR
jgi:hypothetical protein